MIRTIPFLAAFLSIAPAAAQQLPPPEVLSRTINVLEQQRNNAMNAAAMAETRAIQLADDLAKAQARLKELEPKAADAQK